MKFRRPRAQTLPFLHPQTQRLVTWTRRRIGPAVLTLTIAGTLSLVLGGCRQATAPFATGANIGGTNPFGGVGTLGSAQNPTLGSIGSGLAPATTRVTPPPSQTLGGAATSGGLLAPSGTPSFPSGKVIAPPLGGGSNLPTINPGLIPPGELSNYGSVPMGASYQPGRSPIQGGVALASANFIPNGATNVPTGNTTPVISTARALPQGVGPSTSARLDMNTSPDMTRTTPPASGGTTPASNLQWERPTAAY